MSGNPAADNPDLARRVQLLGGAAALLGGGAAKPGRRDALPGDGARLVEAYSPARDAALLPRPKPFTAIFARDGRTLAFVAVTHSTDVTGPSFREIAQAFAKIEPRLLIVEGFPSSLGDNVERVIAQVEEANPAQRTSFAQGEAGYAVSLALRQAIRFRGGGLTDTAQALAMAKEGFGGDDVAFSSLLGPLAQDFRAKVFEGPSDPRFAAAYLRWSRSIPSGGRGAKYRDPQAFRAWYRQAFGQPIDTDPVWYHRGEPGWPGVAGRIGAAVGLIRDRHLYGVIRQALRETPRVLVVFGGGHLQPLWPALVHDLGEPTLLPAA